MKKYEKPTVEVVEIRVKEDIAANNGNTTIYLLGDEGGISYDTLSLFGDPS
jgi:hypothetical protein